MLRWLPWRHDEPRIDLDAELKASAARTLKSATKWAAADKVASEMQERKESNGFTELVEKAIGGRG